MESKEKSNARNLPFFGYRHVVALIGFLSCFLINIQRMSLGVSIVAMVNQTTVHLAHFNSSIKVCPMSNLTRINMKQNAQGEFSWSTQEQGYVLGAGFLGFCIATLPTSKLAKTFQARRMVLYGSILTSLATFISPLAARWHVNLMIGAMFARGLGQGCLFISLFDLMANWFPRKERGLLSTFVISGYSLGSAVASAVTGCICNIQDLGWAGVFYIVGGFGIFHAILSCLVLHETPQEHPRISFKELIYLSDNEEKGGSNKKQSTPWLKIFTSVPFYALLIGLLGQYWTFSYFWTVHSTFLGTIQHFPITENGYWSCLPFLMKAFGEYSTSSIANWLLMKNYITIDVLRRGCNMIGCIGFSAAVFGTYLSECNGSMSAVTAAVSMFFTGVATPGAMIACIDMAPRFAGSLSGLLNGAGCTMSFFVPILVGILTKNKVLSEWHLVFFISIAVVLSSGVVFAIFGSAKVQPWNFVEEESFKDINMVEKNGISPQSLHIFSKPHT
ncbi:vesicular glutamate transporter 2.2 [Trichonephila inaurata madagascariensis]|uniref:Vesicular glutamate transporter 2.2 n=1 Tax=Trichonephila inaurata madagascariensis TaxID=2747483 RepID=A0A8X7CI84_9ARAC|nr:vesicular glutamate transporter 2.2 [Trichonephila inaurata madagascariensis]